MLVVRGTGLTFLLPLGKFKAQYLDIPKHMNRFELSWQ